MYNPNMMLNKGDKRHEQLYCSAPAIPLSAVMFTEWLSGHKMSSLPMSGVSRLWTMHCTEAAFLVLVFPLPRHFMQELVFSQGPPHICTQLA